MKSPNIHIQLTPIVLIIPEFGEQACFRSTALVLNVEQIFDEFVGRDHGMLAIRKFHCFFPNFAFRISLSIGWPISCSS